MMNNVTAIVLAAGRGSRINAKNKNKVVLKLAGKPMISHTISNLQAAGVSDIIVVVGFLSETVKEALGDTVTYATQKKPLGTADAVNSAVPHIPDSTEYVLVTYGDDSAFYTPELYKKMVEKCQKDNADLLFMTVIKEDPTGLGRVIRNDQGEVDRIVEEKNATDKERQVREINSGFYCFKKSFLEDAIGKVTVNPVSGEYYLTDLVEIAVSQNKKVSTLLLDDPNLWHGVNTKEDYLRAKAKVKKVENGKRVHFVGLKGVGMTALALIYKQMSHKVTGSDTGESYVTDQVLAQNDITCYPSFSQSNLDRNLDLVIYSPAYNPNTNPELIAAKDLGIPLLTQSEALGRLSSLKKTVAVCGVGGKTTVTAMTAHILEHAGLNPSYAIGGVLKNSDPGKWGEGEYFVVEADEYANIAGIDLTPKLLLLDPYHIVSTNLVFDHPDVYLSEEDTVKTFRTFFSKLDPQGTLFVNLDDPNTKKLTKDNQNLVTYAADANADWKLISCKSSQGASHLTISHHGKQLELDLIVMGEHNAKNALAAAAVATHLGVSEPDIRNALKTFSGVKRRLELIAASDGKLYYDDYAHHPSEIKATIEAFKQNFPDKLLWVIFQPHTYSRTEALKDGFLESLELADKVSLMPIFSSAREDKSQFNIESDNIVADLKDKGVEASMLEFHNAVKLIEENASNYDILLTMGAGDVYKLHDMIGHANGQK